MAARTWWAVLVVVVAALLVAVVAAVNAEALVAVGACGGSRGPFRAGWRAERASRGGRPAWGPFRVVGGAR